MCRPTRPPPGFSSDVEGAASALQGRLSVSAVKESRLVQISLTDAEPSRAERVLRTLVDIYIDNNVDMVLQSTEVAADWLNVQLAKLRHELDDREVALHDYKRNNQILSVSIDDQNSLLRDELNQLSSALTQVRTQIENLAAREEQLNKLTFSDPTELRSNELLNNLAIGRLRSQWVDAKSKHEELVQSGRGPQHPAVLSSQAVLDQLAAALLTEITNTRAALQGDLQAKRREEVGLRSLHERAKARALDLNALGLEFHRLERARENTEKLYSVVLERTKESDITRFMRFNNIRVLDDARAGEGPVLPRTPINIGFGLVVGLGAGFLLALARTYFDRTFRTPAEVEETLKLPILAVLPQTSSSDSTPNNRSARARKRNGGNTELLVHEQPSSSIAEAARALRTNLTFSAPDKPLRRLLVTSGGPFEGKTTVACWLATSLAQTGKRVLLLDCDLRKPRAHKVFSRDNTVGLTSLLLDPSIFDSLDLTTPVPNLSILVTGPSVPNPAELIQSERFSSCMAMLQAKFDCLVIDSPPIAAVTDAAVLSTLVDGTVLVVRAHSTYRDLAKQAVRMLRDVSSNTLGVVLNGSQNNAHGYGSYRYQYSYSSER